MIDLKRPIAELAAEVRSGKLRAEELVRASLDRIEETEDRHALLELVPSALEEARAVDRARDAGRELGPLAGIPFTAKDNLLTHGSRTTAGSKILEPFQAPYEAVAISRLRAAGAILVAKANLDAFGHGSSTENSDFGPTKNPHDAARVPGGSSGGSATSVALGQACFSVATDTGGSIRQPAAYCGVVGLKVTYGLVPRTGVIAMASSFDTVGPLANSVEDAALVLQVMAGRDGSDATSIERDDAPYTEFSEGLRGRRIGLIREYLGEGLAPQVRARMLEAVEQMKAAGAQVEEVDLPATKLALPAYYILVPAEISSNLARYDGIKYGHAAGSAKTLAERYRNSREEGFGDEAKRRILIGTYVLSSGYYDAYYKRAQKVRTKLIREFAVAFERFDLLLGPTAPTTAFKLGENAKDPLAMYAQDVMTVAANLVGVPAVSIPAGEVDGLPVGLQLMAPQRSERMLLSAARQTEAALKGTGAPR